MKYTKHLALAITALPLLASSAFGQDGAEPTSTESPVYGETFGGWDVQLFKPSARIFFDTGNDDPGEIDLFRDGRVAASIDFANLLYRYDTGVELRNLPDAKLWWGPNVGFGITAPPADSEDGKTEATDAPVFMLSAGLFLELTTTSRFSFLLETGYTFGVTTDEGVNDPSDGAVYVGLSMGF